MKHRYHTIHRFMFFKPDIFSILQIISQILIVKSKCNEE